MREVKKHLEDNHKIKFEDIDDEDMLIAHLLHPLIRLKKMIIRV